MICDTRGRLDRRAGDGGEVDKDDDRRRDDDVNGASILVVDDSADNRRFLVTLLGHHGYRLVEAADGREGLAALQAEDFDLVVTDVLMPVMDGFEFVRQLRLDPETSAIPVAFYTAHYGAREARALAGSIGVSDVLTKPATSIEVLRVVGRLLSGETEAEQTAEAPHLTTQFDREHLRLLTDKVSENAADLRRANSRLRALVNIGLELSSERDAARLLERVVDAARELFGASYVTLGIVDRHDGTVRRVVASGAADCVKIGAAAPGILRTVVVDRRTIRGENPGGNPAALQLPPIHPRVLAYLAAPIASPAQVHGWLCLVGNEGQTFAEEDEPLVLALAGHVGRIYELEHEILERQQAEAAARHERDLLRAAEERLRFALKSADVGIWDMDHATGRLQWSDILENQYGLRPGTFGGTLEAFIERVHPDDRKSVVETIRQATISGGEFSVVNRAIWPDGTVRWLNGAGRSLLDEHGKPLRAVGISVDDTQRRVLEERYLQAQKMETVGRLAGGVAHDFNNLLSVIMGYCELLLGDLNLDDPRQVDIAEIQKAGERAAGLTRQLLAFSRKQIIEPKVFDVNLLVFEMQSMLERLIAEDIRIVLRLGHEPAVVTADRGQIEQVVMNLVVNARDAMPHGGTLTIDTANVELEEDDARAHVAVTPGPYVRLTVTDSGTGMTPQVQARLFEPFFTTKEQGKGTGLGMATVYSIVTRCAGSICVDSEVGRGTSLSVFLPNSQAAAAMSDAPVPAAGPLVGTETVLIVEDEDELRELARRLLQRQGYTVLVAANADEAVRLFAANPSIDIVVTDVVMPGASGPELTLQLVEQRPAIKVIYVSGYTEDAIVQHGVIKPGIAFLNKPFTSEALGRKVREVLER